MTGLPRTRLFLTRELTHALRARWFLVYSGVFLLGGVLLTVLGSTGSLVGGYRGYARALAGLAHFAILFVPLMALFPAAASLAEERENGTLEYLLAQPVTWGQVFLGKWAGVSLAVVLSLTVGYLASAGVAVFRGVPIGLVMATYIFLLFLSLVFVSLGTTLSAISETRSRAVTLGLAVWLVLVAFGSLGAMVAFIRWGAPREILVGWSFFNPVEAFRVGVLAVLDPELDLLGPLGSDLIGRYGRNAVVAGSAASLTGWVLALILAGRRASAWRRDGV